MANIDDLFTSLQQAVQAINTLNQTLAATFPQADAAITHTATAGGDTLPADPSGFLSITLNGVAYKVPLYDA